jgi:peptidoglycan/xylan/chitin deacetylase (PgdA/CDA1 family)
MLRKIPVLLYHRILSKEENLSTYAPRDQVFLLREEELERQWGYLYSNGWRTISGNQLVDCLKVGSLLPEQTLVISFDDGYQTDYTLVFPLLKRLGFKATFFLTTDFIGKSGYLSKSQIVEMDGDGMVFGSHGKTHRFLSTLKERELKYELQKSKAVLEDLICRKVDLLSLPGGYHSSEVKRIALETGYKGIFTSRFDWNTKEADPFDLRRVSLKYADSLTRFISLIKLDARVYLKMRVKWRLLNLLKTVMGPNYYFQLWDCYQRCVRPPKSTDSTG